MKPIQIKRYPDYMIQIAAKCGEPVEITLDTEKAARALRFDFYGLRRAIEREGAEMQFPDFMRATLLVRGNKLIISPPENRSSMIASACVQALAQKPPADNPVIQAQDTTAFEAAIEAWLGGNPGQDKT